jgi:hypothetical protein
MTLSRRAFRAVLLATLAAVPTLARAEGAKPPAAPSGHPAPAAPAAAEYATEVLVLHATNGDKGIDARIGDMPELKKPPFSSFSSYELLQKVKLPLKLDDPRTTDLPNGRVLQTKLLEVLPDNSVRLTASISQPGGKTFLPLLEVKAKRGQQFIVAGQSYKGGILVLVIRVQ